VGGDTSNRDDPSEILSDGSYRLRPQLRLIRSTALLALILLSCGPGWSSPSEELFESSVPRRPVVGAIRWDAWIGPVAGYDVGVQVERSLSPQRWHSRLPFYSEVLSETEVRIRANTQAIMDQEIVYANSAGLDYWAFVMYPKDNPQTLGGVDLYLRSSRKSDINFAMIAQSYTFGDQDLPRLIGYFLQSNYQKVANGRPLLFLAGPQKVDDPAWPGIKKRIEQLRTAAIKAGSKSPYIVHLWGWDGAKEVFDWLNLDAIGAYSLNFGDRAAPYATLANKAQSKWDEWRATGAKVCPLVTTGWDRRPRVEHPVSWEKPDTADSIEFYYATPTPAELAAHLRAALDWCAKYPSTANGQVVLIYAWNEFDEGGWLVPSLWPNQDAQRLKAMRQVLGASTRQ
jgi:hypothetical protein